MLGFSSFSAHASSGSSCLSTLLDHPALRVKPVFCAVPVSTRVPGTEWGLSKSNSWSQGCDGEGKLCLHLPALCLSNTSEDVLPVTSNPRRKVSRIFLMLVRKLVLTSHLGPSSWCINLYILDPSVGNPSLLGRVLLMLSHRRKVHFYIQNQCLMDYCDRKKQAERYVDFEKTGCRKWGMYARTPRERVWHRPRGVCLGPLRCLKTSGWDTSDLAVLIFCMPQTGGSRA